MEEENRKRKIDEELQDQEEELLVQALGDEGEDEQEMLGFMLATVVEGDASDDEEYIPKWGGSVPGKTPNKNRDFKGAHERLVSHYFSGPESLYDETDFERRFRLPRPVFNRIYEKLLGLEPFVQKYDAFTEIAGITPLCRLVAAHRQLCYGEARRRVNGIEPVPTTTNISIAKTINRMAPWIEDQVFTEYLDRCYLRSVDIVWWV